MARVDVFTIVRNKFSYTTTVNTSRSVDTRTEALREVYDSSSREWMERLLETGDYEHFLFIYSRQTSGGFSHCIANASEVKYVFEKEHQKRRAERYTGTDEFKKRKKREGIELMEKGINLLKESL